MNVRDSEVICGLLNKDGCKIVSEPQEAEIILFNTCSVRQHAEDKVWSEVGRYQGKIIGLVGCMAQAHKEDIFKRAPNVDFVVGPSDIHKIPGIISRLSGKRGQSPTTAGSPERSRGKYGDSPLFQLKIWETDGGLRPDEIYHTGFYDDKEHAYVVISEGCSNYCSYCVVPYVRGELRNRNYKDILKEIKQAVDKGISKITLLGQNVNAYFSQSAVSFIDLLKDVNVINGIKEFSFITSHPKDTSSELFKAMADLEKLKKYLHLPVQSGSDRILGLMNRGYTRRFYLDLADNYRKIIRNGTLTTDIIVGFPTETEKDFQDTKDLVQNLGFEVAFIFKYSTRLHTEAAKMVDDVEKKEKERRHRIILDLQRNISIKKRC